MAKASTVSTSVTHRWRWMSPPANQSQMRASTLSGSPKMKAARLGSPKYSGGSSVGLVATCQKTNTPASSASCQKRSVVLLALLLGITLQYFRLHGMPNLCVQLEVMRGEAHLGDV